MTKEQRNEIVHAAVAALMEQLKSADVSAIVTVVVTRDDESTVAAAVADANSPEDGERLVGAAMLAAADLIDEYVHERGLCEDCNDRKEPAN